MQLTLHIPSPNQNWDVIHGILGQKSSEKKCFPFEKTWIFNYFRQKLANENISAKQNFFGQQKLRPSSITTLPKHLSNKQTDLTNASTGNECQSREMQRAMGYAGTISKKFRPF